MLKTGQDYRPDEVCYLELLFRGKNEEFSLKSMVTVYGIFQYMCKELFVMDFNLERCKENVFTSLFLPVSGED